VVTHQEKNNRSERCGSLQGEELEKKQSPKKNSPVCIPRKVQKAGAGRTSRHIIAGHVLKNGDPGGKRRNDSSARRPAALRVEKKDSSPATLGGERRNWGLSVRLGKRKGSLGSRKPTTLLGKKAAERHFYFGESKRRKKERAPSIGKEKGGNVHLGRTRERRCARFPLIEKRGKEDKKRERKKPRI